MKHESLLSIAALRRHIASIERHNGARSTEIFALGAASVDQELGGGLALGRMHEVFAATADNASSAAGFALMLAIRASTHGGAILWLRQEQAEFQAGRLHATGLAELGLNPERLILGIAPDTQTLLKAAADSLRCAGLGAVVIEPWRSPYAIDLTISRRLGLAAEHSGVTAILLRSDAAPVPSVAQSRWEVSGTLSTPLAANAPGGTTFDIKLLRHRGGRDGLAWRVEWNRDRQIFHETPLSGAILPLPAGGPLAAHGKVTPLRQAG
jgi:protein ImuA